tara:strand:+ start:1116 stop:1388 length:273 start_codon:yes stop_codon:yes gene_type:complete
MTIKFDRVRIKSNSDKRYFGPVVVGRSYTVINEGLDWFLLKVRGKPVYIDKSSCELWYEEESDEERDYFGPEDGDTRLADMLHGIEDRNI